MKKLQILALATLALLAAPVASFANHWTAVCSTGVIDEGSVGSGYLLNSVPVASLDMPVVGTVIARYNVTNTKAAPVAGVPPPLPGWTTFELGYTVTGPGIVTARVYRVQPCTGTATQICQVGPIGGGGTNCQRCVFPAAFLPITFEGFLYFVEVEVTRMGLGGVIAANSLRIF